MIQIITMFAVLFAIGFSAQWYSHDEDDSFYAPKYFNLGEAVERSVVVSLILTAMMTIFKVILMTVV